MKTGEFDQLDGITKLTTHPHRELIDAIREYEVQLKASLAISHPGTPVTVDMHYREVPWSEVKK